MLRQKIHTTTHPTRLDISITYKLDGYTTAKIDGMNKSGQSFYSHYHPKSNHELFLDFQVMAAACGPVAEFGYDEIRGRETKITISGLINGEKIKYKKFFSLVEFATFLNKHGVDVAYLQAVHEEKIARGEVKSTESDLHVRGLFNGKKIKDQELHSTKELLNFLNANSGDKNVTYRTVTKDDVVMTRDELNKIIVQNRLFGAFAAVSMSDELDEVAPHAAGELSTARVVDITDDVPEAASPRLSTR